VSEKPEKKSVTVNFLIWLLATAVLIPVFPTQAQQPKKVPRIGFVTGSSSGGPYVDAFQLGLRDLGYDEGRNIVVEYRYAEGKNELFPGFVAELVATQSRCACHHSSTSDPRCQAGD
jgi:hypothetical protein